MNIDRVYICAVYIKTIVEPNGYKYVGNNLMQSGLHKSRFVKYAVVYNNSTSMAEFIDIETGEIYKAFNVLGASVGEMFINSAKGLYPISNILREMYGESKQNLSKRRIKKESKELINMIDNRKKEKENIDN